MNDLGTNIKIFDFAWQIFGAICVTIYHFISVRNKATKNEFDCLKTSLANESKARERDDLRNKERIRDLENKIEHLATRDDLQEIELKIATINQQLVGVVSGLEALSKTTGEIQTYLLDNKL